MKPWTQLSIDNLTLRLWKNEVRIRWNLCGWEMHHLPGWHLLATVWLLGFGCATSDFNGKLISRQVMYLTYRYLPRDGAPAWLERFNSMHFTSSPYTSEQTWPSLKDVAPRAGRGLWGCLPNPLTYCLWHITSSTYVRASWCQRKILTCPKWHRESGSVLTRIRSHVAGLAILPGVLEWRNLHTNTNDRLWGAGSARE